MQRRGMSEILRVEIFDGRKETIHSHQDVELLYILEGLVYLTLDGRKISLTDGDVYIVNSNKMHELYTEHEVLFVKISIFYQQIADAFMQGNLLFLCHSETDVAKLKRMIKKLLEYYIKKEEQTTDFGYLAVCCELIDILQKNFMVKQTTMPIIDEKKFQQRITRINEYIWNNYQMPISMKELSDNLFLSNGYLSRFFKENYGVSFSEYLTNVRLYHATEDLIYTGIPITQIAYDNGFPSAVAFNRVFKKSYQMTPSEYRKEYGQTSVDEKKEQYSQTAKRKLELILAEEKEESSYFEETKGVKEENGIYQAEQYEQLDFTWNQTVNIGAAEDLLRIDICEHISLLKSALKFKYVRFWNLFSKELLLDEPDENGEYNYTKVDYIIDFLLKENFIPHIELGVKAKRIQKNAEVSIIYREDNDISQEPEKWKNCLDCLMKHWTVRYGVDEIDKWRLEISYDAKQKNYAGFFYILNETHKLARRYSSKIQIGAGGIKAGYVDLIVPGFWNEWGLQKWKPDFISIMHYAYKVRTEDGRYYFEQNADINISKEIERVKSYLKIAGMEEEVIYVTEWGSSVSDRNFINDSCFTGAYIIRTVLDTYGHAQMLGYCLGSDRTSQHYDSKTLLFGGRGLISKDGILKPSGFAIEFLNRLYPYKMGHKHSHLLTTDGHNNYALVCHNQKNLNYHYYFTDESMIQKESLDKYFDDSDELQVKIYIAGVPNGIYKMKIYSVNKHNGNILDNWEKMNYDKDISRSDIQYLRRMNEPLISVKKQEVINNTLEISYTLEANEIAYLHISSVK